MAALGPRTADAQAVLTVAAFIVLALLAGRA